MDFEKLRLRGELTRGSDNGIVSFHMADLKDALIARRRINQSLRLFHAGCDGFLHQHINPMFEQIDSDSSVIDRGYCKTHSIDLAEQFTIIRKRTRLVESGNFLRSCLLYVHDAD